MLADGELVAGNKRTIQFKLHAGGFLAGTLGHQFIDGGIFIAVVGLELPALAGAARFIEYQLGDFSAHAFRQLNGEAGLGESRVGSVCDKSSGFSVHHGALISRAAHVDGDVGRGDFDLGQLSPRADKRHIRVGHGENAVVEDVVGIFRQFNRPAAEGVTGNRGIGSSHFFGIECIFLCRRLGIGRSRSIIFVGYGMRSKPIVNLERIVFSGFSSLSTQAMFTIVLVIDVVDAEYFAPAKVFIIPFLRPY